MNAGKVSRSRPIAQHRILYRSVIEIFNQLHRKAFFGKIESIGRFGAAFANLWNGVRGMTLNRNPLRSRLKLFFAGLEPSTNFRFRPDVR